MKIKEQKQRGQNKKQAREIQRLIEHQENLSERINEILGAGRDSFERSGRQN